jgi:hypothetical protein
LLQKLKRGIIITVKKNAEVQKNLSEGYFIHYLEMNYTNVMEKAMLKAHGVCYEVYRRKHKVRMEVEKRRDQEYHQSCRLVADLDRRLHI